MWLSQNLRKPRVNIRNYSSLTNTNQWNGFINANEVLKKQNEQNTNQNDNYQSKREMK